MSANTTDALTIKTLLKEEAERQAKIERIIEDNFVQYDEVFKALALHD